MKGCWSWNCFKKKHEGSRKHGTLDLVEFISFMTSKTWNSDKLRPTFSSTGTAAVNATLNSSSRLSWRRSSPSHKAKNTCHVQDHSNVTIISYPFITPFSSHHPSLTPSQHQKKHRKTLKMPGQKVWKFSSTEAAQDTHDLIYMLRFGSIPATRRAEPAIFTWPLLAVWKDGTHWGFQPWVAMFDPNNIRRCIYMTLHDHQSHDQM